MTHETHDQHQLSLFSGPPLAGPSLAGPSPGGKPEGERSARQFGGEYGRKSRTLVINPHLLAARRIAKRMRRLPERSDAETRAGLAICAQLKAFLADETDSTLNSPAAIPPTRH
jgi:hypothetical protein